MIWPQNGITSGVPFADYRSDDIKPTDTWETAQGKAVSKSLITAFAKDPSAWRSSTGKKKTTAMSFGSLVDCMLLEPDIFEGKYMVSPFDNFKTNKAKEWRADMLESGVEIVTEDALGRARGACDAIKAHSEAAKLLKGSNNQVAFRHETKYGLASKGLIDIVPADPTALVDLKTCEQSALNDQRSLQRHIHSWFYHIQAGAYLEGWNIATGEARTKFKFIFVTSTSPFRVAVVSLAYSASSLGYDQYFAGLKAFAHCLKNDTWPSQWDDVIELDLPAYAYPETALD